MPNIACIIQWYLVEYSRDAAIRSSRPARYRESRAGGNVAKRLANTSQEVNRVSAEEVELAWEQPW